MYELKKDPNEVAEFEWVEYFLKTRKPFYDDYMAVDEAMKTLRTNIALLDAVSLMGQLRVDIHKIMDDHNMGIFMLNQ